MSKKLVDRRRKYHRFTKQQLLDVADEIKYRRFPDGRLTGIDLFKGKALIHQSTAFYVTKEQTLHLSRVTGKFQLEIFNSWISRQARPAWYDRNPIDKSQTYSVAGLAPAGGTRWTYTVPQGKKAFLEFVHIHIHRATVATVAGLAFISIDYTPVGGFSIVPLIVILRTNNIGDRDRAVMGQSGILKAGDLIQSLTNDTSTGGTIDFNSSAKIVEFDA